MRYDIPRQGPRLNPDPAWVTVKWDPKADKAFAAIRKECEDALADVTVRDSRGVWAKKARSAYKEWMEDHQNPVKLFKVSSYLGVANVTDQTFWSAPDRHGIINNVQMGFSLLRVVPESYEFARRAYIMTSGDLFFHKHRDLPFRLLKRDPTDRGVVLAMVREYSWRKPIPEFEMSLFKALEETSKTKLWRPWDDQRWSLAWRMHGQKHMLKSSYDKAIKLAESAIRKTPPGWDAQWIKDYLAETKKEREDPHFGLPANWKRQYIDDLYP